MNQGQNQQEESFIVTTNVSVQSSTNPQAKWSGQLQSHGVQYQDIQSTGSQMNQKLTQQILELQTQQQQLQSQSQDGQQQRFGQRGTGQQAQRVYQTAAGG